MSQRFSFNEPTRAGDPFELTICGVKAVFRYCPPGTFLMGSPESEIDRRPDETLHKVTLTCGFGLLETPVTQVLWKAIMGKNPSKYQGVDTRPVESVSWFACADFISKLNAFRLASDVKFDFPTEAEWEYACRAGTTTPFNVGDELTEEDANFNGNIGETSPVKTYQANAWGLYDMHGNVFEWCKDWIDDYPLDSVTDPERPFGNAARIMRGGSWNFDVTRTRSASRDGCDPADWYEFIGIRLALRFD